MKIKAFTQLVRSKIRQNLISNHMYIYILLAMPFFIQQDLSTRSVHRPKNAHLPTVKIQWEDENSKILELKSRYLLPRPFFELFDKDFYESHMLPSDKISYRYETEKSVTGKELGELINKVIKQVKSGKRIFEDFDILRDTNFNYRTFSGLLILKCKHHPFVVKIFMENPNTLVQPFRKGIEPMFFYFMAGGANRHNLGHTRIKNLEEFNEKIKKHPVWSKRVVLPRKWYFEPETCRWIKLTGINFGPEKLETSIPGAYCIVADAMRIERRMTLLNKKDRKESLALCNYVNYSIDPHIDNFGIEEETGLIVLVDTERMNDIVGWFDIQKEHTSQLSWYFDLATKCFADMFFKPKPTSRTNQI